MEGEAEGGCDSMKESPETYVDGCWGAIMGETDGASRCRGGDGEGKEGEEGGTRC